ncbi:SdiA-regulated domain-containing protein [Sphaerotilus montanus]|uniref:Uncharacterized protein YjiK n=1 Tax=Sphaerotilus montanus TaxID=522889 RepID=A0A7Y9QU73_9BURK|nr:SdiA-regulated domain-containing protein [Sphaerotilus montanus]NYG31488.1 uncharacterized protein YjiK [Sphaerotilus montanus]NZD58687.1 SdiA-regulated domain-containing protein [Sphaerotilus montanus]
MRFKLKSLVLGLLLAGGFASAASAATSLGLGNYTVTGNYALDVQTGLGGSISGLEASAVTFASDRGTLFFVGDEGTGVIEVSLTGQTLGSMSFDWAGTGSTKHDTEALTYLGGGVLVVGEERLVDAYRFSFGNGGTAVLTNSGVSISNAVVGNSGMEGISYDARNGGSFVSIKQEAPQDILAGTLTFAAGVSGTSTMASLFDPALMGLATLSDVQVLSGVTSLAGTAGADNLLVFSLGSQRLVEVTRTGQVLSSFDFSTVSPNNAIEGVTIDQNGVIYLVAEQVQNGASLDPNSRLFVLSPVPEPETYALMLAGLVALAVKGRRPASARRD